MNSQSSEAAAGLTATQLASFDAAEIAALGTQTISGFSSGQIAALTNTQIAALTPGQIGALSATGTVTVPDLFATFCASLGLDGTKENLSSNGRPIKLVDGGEAVRELL